VASWLILVSDQKRLGVFAYKINYISRIPFIGLTFSNLSAKRIYRFTNYTRIGVLTLKNA
jgi:hypothetical protein